MKRTVPLFFLLFCICCLPGVYAQTNGEIRGQVRDRDGSAVVGARVTVTAKSGTGAKRGAIVNLQGVYSIKNLAPGEYDITVSAVSYKEQTKTANVGTGSTELDFSMIISVSKTQEIVVTGQGTAIERKRLTTTVESITAKEIDVSPARSVDQLLQGRVPGLTSFVPGGLPGVGARMQTRGVKSALSSTNPVIYVDGVRVDAADNFRLSSGEGGLVSSSLADLVTGDIERIEVIKGGAGSTLYGTEAANGIIQIFTKKGTPGEAKWRAGVQAGIDSPEFRFTNQDDTKNYVYQTGFFQGYNLNVTGGNEGLTYNLSGKIQSSTGVVARNSTPNQIYNVATGLQAKLSDKLTVEFSGSFTRNQFNRILLNNTTSPLSDIETESLFQPYSGNEANIGNKDSVMDLYYTPEIKEIANRFTSSVSVNYTPFSWLNNRFTVGIDYRKSNSKQIFGLNTIPIYGAPASVSRSDREFSTVTLTYNGTVQLPEISDYKHDLIVGIQGFRIDDTENFGIGENLAVPTQDIDQSAVQRVREDARQLFNGGAFVNYKSRLFDRIFFDAGIRVDGSSTFGDGVSLQVFPKASAAWNISDESFYPEDVKPIINSFKVRASWGQTGNFPPPFTRDKQFNVRSFRDAAAVDFGNPGNQALAPEKTTSTEIGFDMSLFEDRLSLIVDYFDQQTVNGLFDKLNDPASGLLAQQTNLGTISNKGFEVSLNGILVDTEDFGINFRAAFATLENKVISLGGSAPFSIGGFAFLNLRLEEGHPVGIFRTNVPIADTSGANIGQYTGLVRLNVLRGTPTPTMTGSLGFDFRIGSNLTINMFGEFARGHQVMNQDLSRRIVNALAFRNRGNATMPTTYPAYPDAAQIVPRHPQTNEPLYDRNTASDYLLENADWFKLREVSIRYKIPDIMRGLTVSLSGRNLFVITAANVDPETSFIRAGSRAGTGNTVDVGGIAGATIVNPRQFRLGLELNW